MPEKFRYYDESDIYDQYGRTIPMDLYAFWDIAQGKTGAATTMQLLIGRCRRTGVLYVLDAWAQKCQAHVALKVAVEKIIEYESIGSLSSRLSGLNSTCIDRFKRSYRGSRYTGQE
ncbi:hypothetical protein P7H17_16725 [Paenibacillus larvae]|nr:hypothetical protein [Paenibacillus larvae]MDT2287352.1 hypothetical protein [Paenibacillus larvae]